MEFNLAQVHEAIASALAERECIVWRDRRLTYGQVTERTRRLANHLLDQGLGVRTERSALAGHESGQDHLACYLHNGNEYLEAMLGAYKARVAPFNVNYRYVAEELRYLLNDAGARAIVFHSAFGDRLAEVLPDLPQLEVLLQVDDGSGARAAARRRPGTRTRSPPRAPSAPTSSWSPDDLYILYTGGTTGMPKGVLWRQADIFVGAMGGRNLATGEEWESLDADRRVGGQRRGAAAARTPVHARRRALAGLQRLHRRQHGRASRTTPSGSTRPTSGAPSPASRSTSCSSSATPSADRSSTSSRRPPGTVRRTTWRRC